MSGFTVPVPGSAQNKNLWHLQKTFLKTTIAGTATLAIGGCNTFASTETKAGSIAGKAQLNISFQEVQLRGYTSREV